MEKKVCKVCGRELPLSHFRKNHLSQDGYVSTCTQCVTRKRKEGEDKTLDVTPPQGMQGGNPELSAFTPRELMAELKARGFKGKLSIVREVVL